MVNSTIDVVSYYLYLGSDLTVYFNLAGVNHPPAILTKYQ
jgi:hypothetical protein